MSQLEKDFLAKPWAEVREAVQVKLVEQDGELYILARSGARRDKEQAMRRRRLKKLVKRLHELQQQKLTRDQLLIKLGATGKRLGRRSGGSKHILVAFLAYCLQVTLNSGCGRGHQD